MRVWFGGMSAMQLLAMVMTMEYRRRSKIAIKEGSCLNFAVFTGTSLYYYL
jgi:hypothetical protein